MIRNGQPAGDVLPRPRILNAIGILNIIFAVFLMIYSVSIGGYTASVPMSNRAMGEVRARAEADLEAKRQADLDAIEQAEKTATTAAEKSELAARRKALEARPKVSLPLGLDLEKMGFVGRKFTLFSVVDVTTALLLDIAMLIAGIALLRRRIWGVRLATAVAAAKIIRLVVLYSYAVLAIVPPIAQGVGRLVFESMMQQQTLGAKTPPGMNAAFFTKLYFVFYTVMAVSMMLFGSIYPAISLWFLSRPGARAACEPAARHNLALSETRVLGITNIVFAACLILFGLCFGSYVAAMPILGRTLVQIQKKSEAANEAKQKAALKGIADDEAKATTDSEKEALAQRRKAIESRPKPPNPFAAIDFGQMGLDDPKVVAYYWVELASGLLLNLAMIAAGIGLVRQKPWATGLGMATAAAKIARLVVVYSYFAVAVAPVLAERYAVVIGRMMVQQQAIMGITLPQTLDTRPIQQTYTSLYPPIAVAFIVLGSIYPAVSLWLLRRGQTQTADEKKAPPGPELAEAL